MKVDYQVQQVVDRDCPKQKDLDARLYCRLLGGTLPTRPAPWIQCFLDEWLKTVAKVKLTTDLSWNDPSNFYR